MKDKILKEVTRFLKRLLDRIQGHPETPAPSVPHQEQEPEHQEQEPEHQEGQSTIDLAITIHSFGSPNCSKAQEDPNTQIKDLTISDKGLSYGWAKGNLRNWGIQDDHAAKALAIAGYSKDNKTYHCAKFDWISSDRLTRDFKNIEEGYNGFNCQEFKGAPYKCFFIMSADGKKRTNVICTFKPMK